jgi:hypothetical protein
MTANGMPMAMVMVTGGKKNGGRVHGTIEAY